jgi:catechol 2,3-dioxygenase-like lactoylglutathione lyase family enzyme
LSKEVPRFRDFRRAGIEVWHECRDLDLAVWIDKQDRLSDLRRAAARALAAAQEPRFGVCDFQVDLFLFEPGSDRYLGRLCNFSTCPKGNKLDCLTPGCGTIPFNKMIPGFEINRDLLETIAWSTLYRRGEGVICSAMDLPGPGEEAPPLTERHQGEGPVMIAEPQLFVRDLDAACSFYRGRLGFEIAFAHGEPPFYAQARRGGWRLNLRRVRGPVFAADFREREGDALSATLVMDDVRPLFAEYEATGLAFHRPLRAEPWGALTFIVRDPDDNLIAFTGHAPRQ